MRKYIIYAGFLGYLININTAFCDEELFWFDESNKIIIYEKGFSRINNTLIYSESLKENPVLQVLSGNIIVVFHGKKSEEDLSAFGNKYGMTIKSKINIGSFIYLFKVPKKHLNDSLSLANRIFQAGEVKASYPDWIYINDK